MLEAKDPLVIAARSAWLLGPGIGSDSDCASWGDANCRDPACIVVRILTGRLEVWQVVEEADSFGPGINTWLAAARRVFGPDHEPLLHSWCLDIQELVELTSVYSDRYYSDPAAFVRKLSPLVRRMRLALQPLLTAMFPERVRRQLEDTNAVASATEVPEHIRNFALAALRVRGPKDEDDVETKVSVKKDPESKTPPPDKPGTDGTPGTESPPSRRKRPEKRLRDAAAAAKLDSLVNGNPKVMSEQASADSLKNELAALHAKADQKAPEAPKEVSENANDDKGAAQLKPAGADKDTKKTKKRASSTAVKKGSRGARGRAQGRGRGQSRSRGRGGKRDAGRGSRGRRR